MMAGGLFPPIQVIATWRPNYIHPERSGNDVIIVTAVMLFVAWVVFLMRMYARFHLTKSAGIDDALIILTMACMDQSSWITKLIPLVASICHGWFIDVCDEVMRLR